MSRGRSQARPSFLIRSPHSIQLGLDEQHLVDHAADWLRRAGGAVPADTGTSVRILNVANGQYHDRTPAGLTKYATIYCQPGTLIDFTRVGISRGRSTVSRSRTDAGRRDAAPTRRKTLSSYAHETRHCPPLGRRRGSLLAVSRGNAHRHAAGSARAGRARIAIMASDDAIEMFRVEPAKDPKSVRDSEIGRSMWRAGPNAFAKP
jgi:hypothetical protein